MFEDMFEGAGFSIPQCEALPAIAHEGFTVWTECDAVDHVDMFRKRLRVSAGLSIP